MVDPVFKAPPPPVNPSSMSDPAKEQIPSGQDAPVSQNASTQPTAAATSDEQQPVSQKQQVMDRLNELKDRMVQYFWYSIAGLFLLGAFFGCAMSGSSPAPQPTQNVVGISNRVIANGDKKTRLFICGSVAPSQSCLFYVLNSKSYDRVAEDFFEDISRATGRSVFNIRLDNPLYQKQPIRPGYFAEVIVPSMN